MKFISKDGEYFNTPTIILRSSFTLLTCLWGDETPMLPDEELNLLMKATDIILHILDRENQNLQDAVKRLGLEPLSIEVK